MTILEKLGGGDTTFLGAHRMMKKKLTWAAAKIIFVSKKMTFDAK